MGKYFICSYTAKTKSYCDKEVFGRLLSINPNIHVIDNSDDGGKYSKELSKLGLDTTYLIVPPTPTRTKFLRAVEESVLSLRDDFLNTNSQYFLIVESDVLVPKDLIPKFEEALSLVEDHSKLGGIGGIYYQGFHDYTLEGLQATHHILSGCTLYTRKAIKEIPFRWSAENLGAFPDAWWSLDANSKGYNLYNYHPLVCEHLHSPNGTRYV